MKTLQKTSLALLLVTAATSAACTTEDLNAPVLVTSKVDGPLDAAGEAGIAFHMTRTDLYDANNDRRDLPAYNLNVDGKDVVLDTGDRVLLPAGASFIALKLASGLHTFRMRTEDGRIDVTSPNVELPGGMLSHMVVFGDPSAPQQRFYTEDPSLVPAGARHLRFLNALDQKQMVQIGRCSTAGDAPCTPSGAPLAFGDVFETDEPDQADPTVGVLSWWSLPVAQSPARAQAVAAPPRGPWPELTSPIVPYSLDIPIHIGLPDSSCSGCVAALEW